MLNYINLLTVLQCNKITWSKQGVMRWILDPIESAESQQNSPKGLLGTPVQFIIKKEQL